MEEHLASDQDGLGDKVPPCARDALNGEQLAERKVGEDLFEELVGVERTESRAEVLVVAVVAVVAVFEDMGEVLLTVSVSDNDASGFSRWSAILTDNG